MSSIMSILMAPMHDACDIPTSLRNMFSIGCFVALFLWFFEPFGFSRIQGDTWPYALAFGGITFASGMLQEIIELKILRIRKDLPTWTFWKWLLSTIVLLLLITTGNMLYASYISGWESYDLSYYLQVFQSTLAIGIFPIIIFGVWNVRRNGAYYRDIATGMHVPVHHQRGKQPACLPSRTGDDIEVDVSQIAYIEATQNYLNVYVRQEQGLQRRMIRNTLKEIKSVLKAYPDFIQCHRSFLVNMEYVEDVKGNSQGLILHLDHSNTHTVPVSRTYVSVIRHKMEALV